MSEITEYSFARNSRTPRAMIGVAVYLAIVLTLWQVVDVVGWITALLLLPALPALFDLGRNSRAGLTLNDAVLGWFSGRRTGQIALAEIDKVRFDTRWDFSVRVTLLPREGRKLRLPQESLPPHRELETLLQERGLKVERHHFVVF